jgi:hypothetical protein
MFGVWKVLKKGATIYQCKTGKTRIVVIAPYYTKVFGIEDE